jgi:hypothetical protein
VTLVADLDEEGLDIRLSLRGGRGGQGHAVVPLLLLDGGGHQEINKKKKADVNERRDAQFRLVFLRGCDASMSGHGGSLLH